MALPQNLEKLVSLITDPAEREATRKDLEGGFLRQEDYSRKMNELSEADKVRRAAYDTGKKWVEENRTYYKEAVSQRDSAMQRAKEAEERLASLATKTNQSNDHLDDINVSDEASLAKALKEAREEARLARNQAAEMSKTVTKIDEMIASGQILTADQIQAEAAKQFDAYGEAVISTIETLQRANGEFGKTIDRKTLLAEAAKYGGDLNKAYESVTADLRLEKLKQDIRADVTKEFEAKMAAAGTPLATGGSPVELGPLQAMVYAKNNPESTIDPSIPADGSGRLAHAMAAELRAEGKY